jgi:hypothetical protein
MSFPGVQPRFLTVDDVVVLQRLAINEFGVIRATCAIMFVTADAAIASVRPRI